MDSRRKIRDFFIPSLQNQLRPYSLRYKTLVFVVIFAAAIELAFFAYVSVAFKKNVLLGNIVSGIQSTVADVLPDVIVNETNSYRRTIKEKPLTVNYRLALAAKMKAADMASRGYFSHEAPDGGKAWDWMGKAGYEYSYAGENLAVNFFDARDVVRAWMDSPSHRANILNRQFTEIGIGVSRGTFEGRETVFVVQMFGTPAAPEPVYQKYAESAPDPVPAKKTAARPTAPQGLGIAGTSSSSSTSSSKAAAAATGSAALLPPLEVGFATSVSAFPVSAAARTMVSPRHVVRDAYMVLIAYVLLCLLVPMAVVFKNHQSSDYGLRLREIIILFRKSIISSFAAVFLMGVLLWLNYWWALSGTGIFDASTFGFKKS